MGKQYKALVLGFLFFCSVILPSFSFQKETQAVEVVYTAPFSPWITIKNLVWTGLANGDTGRAFVGLGGWDTATVQVTGTFAGATCTIEASNDIGTPTWYTAKDITTAGVYVINAGYYQVRPKISAGAGATLTITLVATESTPDTKNLDDLLDVVISSPANTQVIKYNSTTSKWENSAAGGAGAAGGSDTYVQFNNSGTLDGNVGFTYNKSTTVPTITLTDTDASSADLQIDVNANIAQIRAVGGAVNSLITLNLNNGRFGFKSSAADYEVDFHTAIFAIRNTLGDLGIVCESSAHAQIHLNSPAGFIGVLNFSDKWRIGRYWDENFSIVHIPTSTVSFFISNVTRNIGIGTTTPTARLHLPAGTAAANTSPLKFTTGTLLTTAEAGAVEFLTDAFYGTITTGAARKTFAFAESLTDGSVSALFDELRFDRVRPITGTDLNVLTTSGFYDGNTLTNAPGASTGWFYIEHLQHSNASDPAWRQQIAYGLGSPNSGFSAAGTMYIRTMVNNVWQAWRTVTTT